MSEGFRRVGPEGQLCLKDSLTLKASALSYEQMVEVALQRLLVNVENFTAKVQTEGTIRPPKLDQSSQKVSRNSFWHIICKQAGLQRGRFAKCSLTINQLQGPVKRGYNYYRVE